MVAAAEASATRRRTAVEAAASATTMRTTTASAAVATATMLCECGTRRRNECNPKKRRKEEFKKCRPCHVFASTNNRSNQQRRR